MEKRKHVIMGIHITDRLKHAGEVQKVFTEFGCHIKTRLGLHEVTEERCAPNGVVVLELVGPDEKLDEMAARLGAIEGIEVQRMVFTHE